MNTTLAAFITIVSLVTLPQLSRGQTVELIVSSLSGDRLAQKPPLRFQQGARGGAVFHIDERSRRQRIAGFGASFLEAGMVCLNSLNPGAREDVFKALFDPDAGAGFSAMKTVIAGTDFMSAGPWYTYNDVPGDTKMKHFSIERDLGTNGLVSYIHHARRYGRFALQAPMDYPPDWMLVNVTNRAKQDIDPTYYDALTLYYLRYLQEYAKQGITIDYLCLFNEPGTYTKIPYEKIVDLLKHHVGPRLAKEGLATKIMLSEACNRNDAHRYYPKAIDDPEVRKYVAALPYHGYDSGNFDKIAELHARYPDLPLWMTEHCYFKMDVPKVENLPRYDFEDGDFWGNQIVSDLEAGASAWVYWNMVLDEKGGPCLVSPAHGNPEFNVQHPVVIVNRQTKQVTYTGCYYYLSHFSKFVRPGSFLVGATGSVPGVRCIAFLSPENALVAQLLNHSDKEIETTLVWRNQALPVKLPPVSITTCRWSAEVEK